MALPALALFAVSAAGAVTPAMVYALVFVRGAINAVDNPARQSFVFEMVGADRVVNAVSLNSVIVHSARVAGPAIGGILIATAGVEACFALNAAHVRRDGRGAGAHGPGAAAALDAGSARARRGSRRASLRPRAPPSWRSPSA